ncbi:MAG: DUF3221 domain-containing protein [Mollicutes bacterium]|nr:DUF3221 domain-containing protein [Mollicutes bacterium]
MKKKVIIILILIIITLIPIPMRLKDGGSMEYKAILYKIIKVHKLNEQYQGGYEKGWKINILGIQVYNKTDIKLKSDEVILEAKIVDINNDGMLVEVTKDTKGFGKGNHVSVNISEININIKENLNIDFQIKITFNGSVNESYPPQIDAEKIDIIT